MTRYCCSVLVALAAVAGCGSPQAAQREKARAEAAAKETAKVEEATAALVVGSAWAGKREYRGGGPAKAAALQVVERDGPTVKAVVTVGEENVTQYEGTVSGEAVTLKRTKLVKGGGHAELSGTLQRGRLTLTSEDESSTTTLDLQGRPN